MDIEKRQFNRYKITFPVEFVRVSTPNIIYRGEAINISLGGVQILLKEETKKEYDRLIIKLFLPNHEVIEQIDTQVMYVKSQPEGILIGLMFNHLGKEKYGKLKNFLENFVKIS